MVAKVNAHRPATKSDQPRPLTWPAAELHPRWPEIDPGLAAWRYRRVLDAIRTAEALRTPSCTKPCCAEPQRECETADVLIAVPVPNDWRWAPDRRTIAAYGCVATLVSREQTEGTVLALFPRAALRREMTRRLRDLKYISRPPRSRPERRQAA